MLLLVEEGLRVKAARINQLPVREKELGAGALCVSQLLADVTLMSRGGGIVLVGGGVSRATTTGDSRSPGRSPAGPGGSWFAERLPALSPSMPRGGSPRDVVVLGGWGGGILEDEGSAGGSATVGQWA